MNSPDTTDKLAIAALVLFILGLGALWLSTVVFGAPRRVSWRQIDQVAEAEHGNAPGVLKRHRRYERAQRRCYPRPFNGGKSAVCGPHQILVWDMTSRDGKRLARLVKGRLGGAAAAALLLKESRLRFDKECGNKRNLRCVCPWQFLNNGDRSRLCARLEPNKRGGTS